MTAADLLRRAADALDDYVVSPRVERVAKLMALKIIRACGSGVCEEEARLLCELLDD